MTFKAIPILFCFLAVSFCDEHILASCRSSTHIRCADGLSCIHKKFMCDGRIDCPDHSDEQSHICNRRGLSGSIKKSSEKFFSSQVKCPQNWFACQDLSKCLQPKLVCDNVKDCNDGSDEREFCYEHQKNLIRTEDHTIVY